MMKWPDYDASILSITSSVMEHYGKPAAYPALDEIGRMLETRPRNIVFILLDGMGDRILKRRLPEDAFLRAHTARTLTSVYPSTTTAATTACWTDKSPLEHGWLGWSLYFKECARQIDVFLDRDSHTGDRYSYASPGETYMPFETIYERLKGTVETHTIFPFESYASHGADYRHICRDFDDEARMIRQLCIEPREKLIVAYCAEPDHTMHEVGVDDAQTQAVFDKLNARAQELCLSLSPDTLVIFTADHGMMNMGGCVKLTEHPSLMECLVMPPFMESRAASFYVKRHMRAQFEREFARICGEDFLLLTREEVFEKHLLGRGNTHPKTDDFIGDYLACAISDKFFSFNTPANRAYFLTGQHAGLTEDEMIVPLILYRTKGNK